MNNIKDILKIFDKNKYQFDKEVNLYETTQNGRASLILKSKNTLFAISLSHKNKIVVFNHKQVADWIVVEFLDNNKINLHIIELKRTITETTWQKVKSQFLGAYEHSYLLKGVFNYEVNEILLYTAFVKDESNLLNTTNPVMLKSTNGSSDKTSAIDWTKNVIKIKEQKFRHIKIELNLDKKVGIGEYEIKGNFKYN